MKLLFALEQSEQGTFTIKDAKRILGTSSASVKNVLKRLKRKKRLIPLQKGAYLYAPLKSGRNGKWSEDAFKIVRLLANTDRHYIGFVTAMSHWGMTEQIPYVMFVALERQKREVKAVQTRFQFVKVKKLGEFEKVQIGGVDVNISTIEQTIIDGLAHPKYCAGIDSVTKAIAYSEKRMNWEKLISMAMEGKSVIRRRLGYLLELLGLKKYAKKLEGKFTGYSFLEASAQKGNFSYSKKWGLKVNVEKDDLLEFQRGF